MITRKGFTLVELSIVLVIIGLLIGGILAAQSMIGTAKIQGVVRQLSQYDVAVTNFQTKYNQIPSDSNLFGTGGDNDGSVIQTQEISSYWNNLSLGVGLKNSAGSDYQPFDDYHPGTTVNSNTCPSLKLDNNPVASPCLYARDRDYGSGHKTWYQYDEFNLDSSFMQNVIKPSDALAIDTKIDDGNGTTGNILNYATSGVSQVYNLSNNSYSVELSIAVGTTNGTAN